MQWWQFDAQRKEEAARVNSATLQRLYRDRTSKHLGFSAVEMALITLIMSPSKHLVRDDHGRWNHPDAEASVPRADRKPGWRFKQGFSYNTINTLIDAGRCEAVRFGGTGVPVEVRLLPL